MQKIYLKKYLGENKSKLIITGFLDNNGVRFEGDQSIQILLSGGIPHPSEVNLIVVPSDGQIFIQAMLSYFDSPYLYAELENN